MKNPFIAGNWVRGDNFFGREELLRDILDGQQSHYWVTGTRRFGKTSLLKQIELLAGEEPYRTRYVTLFWDLQGSQDTAGLAETLLESVEDNLAFRADFNIDPAELEGKDLFAMLRFLKNQARQADRTLLLLCDECEELLNVERNDPGALPRLRRAFQQGGHIKTVICATKRLLDLEGENPGDTSPFLHGFIPPNYLGPLSEEAATGLISLGNFTEEQIRHIMGLTNCHPYLIQLLCKRALEMGNMEAAEASLVYDDMVSRFFQVDFAYLNDGEKAILWHVLGNNGIDPKDLSRRTAIQPDNLATALTTLINLGYIRDNEKGLFIANAFLERWLMREKDHLFAGILDAPPPASREQRSAGSGSSSGTSSDQVTRISSERPGPEGRGSQELEIGRYQVEGIQGGGGMGRVFKGYDPKLERRVAIKQLSPEISGNKTSLDRFFQEARAAASLNHTHIAAVYEINAEENDQPYLVMEYVDGPTLATWRRSDPPPSFPEKLRVAREIAAGLAYAHQKKVIHRDIKPENILLTENGVVKITDFGLARILGGSGTRLTRDGLTMGTLAYMAPEQVSGRESDHRCDIYGLGVVYFELFCDRLPVEANNDAAFMYALIHQPIPKVLSIAPALPPALADLIDRMLSKEPEERPGSMDEVLSMLNGIG